MIGPRHYNPLVRVVLGFAASDGLGRVLLSFDGFAGSDGLGRVGLALL